MANADPTLPDVDPPSPRDPTLTPAEPTSASVDPKWGSTGPKPADVAPPPSRDLAATPGGPALTSGGLPSPSAAPEPPPPAPAQRRPRPAAAILGRGGGRGGPVAMGRVSMATPGAPTAAESPRPLPWRCARTAAPASASAGQWEGGTAHFRPLTSGFSDFRCFFSGFRSERGRYCRATVPAVRPFDFRLHRFPFPVEPWRRPRVSRPPVARQPGPILPHIPRFLPQNQHRKPLRNSAPPHPSQFTPHSPNFPPYSPRSGPSICPKSHQISPNPPQLPQFLPFLPQFPSKAPQDPRISPRLPPAL